MGHSGQKEHGPKNTGVDPLVALVDPKVTVRFEQPGLVRSDFSEIQYYLASHEKPLISPQISNLFGFEDLEWHRQQIRKQSQTRMYLGYTPPAVISDEINLVQTAAATIVVDEGSGRADSNGHKSPKTISIAGIANTDQARADFSAEGIIHTPEAKRVIAARFSLSGRGNLESFLVSLSFPEQKYVEELGNSTPNEAFTELLSRIPTMRDTPRSHPGFITDAQRRITDDTEGIIVNQGWKHGFHFGDVSEADEDTYDHVQTFAQNLGFSLTTKKNVLSLTFSPPDIVPDFRLAKSMTRHIFTTPPEWTIPFPTQLAAR